MKQRLCPKMFRASKAEARSQLQALLLNSILLFSKFILPCSGTIHVFLQFSAYSTHILLNDLNDDAEQDVLNLKLIHVKIFSTSISSLSLTLTHKGVQDSSGISK